MDKEIEINETIAEEALLASLFINSEKKKKEQTLKDLTKRFTTRIKEAIEPNLRLDETFEKIIKTAIEVEFGANFTSAKGSVKMIKDLAQVLSQNTKLRRQALNIVNFCLEEKLATTNKKA